jgi:hypothetical protein
MSVVVLTGGVPHAHDFVAIGGALARIVAGTGESVVAVDHPDAAAAALTTDTTALVVNGLWWRMDNPGYEQWRDHAYSPPAATREAVTSFVERGGGLLALHTATICFDDWPQWGRLLGGRWRWGVSSHPPRRPVRAELADGHPLTVGLSGELEIDDEVYGDLDIGDVTVGGWARRHEHDPPQPIIWTHHYGAGRVAYDGFGHDERSLTAPTHRAIIERALAWVGGAA